MTDPTTPLVCHQQVKTVNSRQGRWTSYPSMTRGATTSNSSGRHEPTGLAIVPPRYIAGCWPARRHSRSACPRVGFHLLVVARESATPMFAAVLQNRTSADHSGFDWTLGDQLWDEPAVQALQTGHVKEMAAWQDVRLCTGNMAKEPVRVPARAQRIVRSIPD